MTQVDPLKNVAKIRSKLYITETRFQKAYSKTPLISSHQHNQQYIQDTKLFDNI